MLVFTFDEISYLCYNVTVNNRNLKEIFDEIKNSFGSFASDRNT